ncbi:MAG: hypothetical protein AAF772_06585, partial [Acidobacteriota bacterium]
MLVELCLYVELLTFFVGALLYGFLARALVQRPSVLPDNRPVRMLFIALAAWYALTLVDHLIQMLVGGVDQLPTAGVGLGLLVALDVVRAGAWLASFPLLVHALVAIARVVALPRGAGRAATVIAYLSLLAFALPMRDFLSGGSALLAEATRVIYPRVVLHAALTLLPAMV